MAKRSSRSGRDFSSSVTTPSIQLTNISNIAPGGFVTRSELAPLGPYAAAGYAAHTPYAPAGAVPTTGTPPTRVGPGRYAFRSTLLALGADPSINTSGFAAQLRQALAEILSPSALTLISASILKGRQEVTSFARAPGTVLSVALPNRNVQSWYVTVEGEFSTPNTIPVNGDVSINRSIARAVARSTGFGGGYVDSDYRSVLPTDGAMLDRQFRTQDACAGGINTSQVWARACTRFERTGDATPATPAPTPATPTPTPATPSVPVPSLSQTCAVRIAAVMYLRDSATFSRTNAQGQQFPAIPAGTAVTITGPQIGASQGRLGLYPVSVAGRAGFGALSPEDMIGCTLFAPPRGTSPASIGGGSSTVRPTPSQLAVQTSGGNQNAQPNLGLALTGDTSGDHTIAYGLAAAAVVAIAGVAIVKRKEIKAAFYGGDSHGHRKANGRKSRRKYNRRRSRRSRRTR